MKWIPKDNRGMGDKAGREVFQRLAGFCFRLLSLLTSVRWPLRRAVTAHCGRGSTSVDLFTSNKAVVILRPVAEEIHFLAQEVGADFYARMVRPEFMAAVRSVVSGYPMVTVPEKSVEIANKIQAVVVEKLKGRHLEIQSVALADVDFPQIVLSAIEQKQAKEQQKEQKEFELIIAEKDAEIARRRARGEGDAIRIRSEGEAQGLQIRAEGKHARRKSPGPASIFSYSAFFCPSICGSESVGVQGCRYTTRLIFA